MDTTEDYIKMCEKAEEIQKLWEPKRGDIVYDIADNKNIWRSRDWRIITTAFTLVEGNRFHIDSYQDICQKEDYIWLPRQDQLQEMAIEHRKLQYPNYDGEGKVIGYNYGLSNLLNSFNGFMYDVGRGAHSKGMQDSMERMWLAFLMWVKFEKSWNGKEWVKNG